MIKLTSGDIVTEYETRAKVIDAIRSKIGLCRDMVSEYSDKMESAENTGDAVRFTKQVQSYKAQIEIYETLIEYIIKS